MKNWFEIPKDAAETKEEEISEFDFLKSRVQQIVALKAPELIFEIRGAIKFSFWRSHSITVDQFSELMKMLGEYGDTSSAL